ncbi:bacteriophage-like protein [Pandoraea sp. SD6-2]|uniref:bacteriophage-like protein n=1 Tax=Pandoraea sp. SD6-2 TaxID=1286093 RepID=UPI00032EBEA6|nr:bacteriophage-like protein [Pandoraea sp. SD6-2]EON13155.1 bacteriophage-like protein [Pandoraea sp. SD6-2]
MKEFGDLASFAAHLGTMAAATDRSLHHGLKKVAVVIEKRAETKFGHYQTSVGPFSAWAPLAEATKADRVASGFTPDDPLLRTGSLRDSIGHQVSHLEAIIGSPDDRMVWQELGTDKIPPRPVLGPAAVESKKEIERIVAGAAVSGLLGGDVMAGALAKTYEG